MKEHNYDLDLFRDNYVYDGLSGNHLKRDESHEDNVIDVNMFLDRASTQNQSQNQMCSSSTRMRLIDSIIGPSGPPSPKEHFEIPTFENVLDGQKTFNESPKNVIETELPPR